MAQTRTTSAVRHVRMAAGLVSAGSLLSGPVAILVVALAGPQPAWTNADVFVDRYRPVQALPYLLGFILLTGFVLFAAACHAGADRASLPRTSAALVFTGIYASLVFTNYTIQVGYVPEHLHDRSAAIAELTMANPSSFGWFLEMFGYAAMGVATWLLSACFDGVGRRAAAVRLLLSSNGVLSVLGAVFTALIDRFVFSGGGLVCFAVWNAVVVVCFGLIATTPDTTMPGITEVNGASVGSTDGANLSEPLGRRG